MNDQPAAAPRRKAVGIDLGTTFSAIAHIGRQNRMQIVRNTGLSENEIANATADLSLIEVV